MTRSKGGSKCGETSLVVVGDKGSRPPRSAIRSSKKSASIDIGPKAGKQPADAKRISTVVGRKALKKDWPVFTGAVHSRLCAGAKEYGDGSFGKDPADLIGEIEQELFDVMGWTFVLWKRVRSLLEDWERARAAMAPNRRTEAEIDRALARWETRTAPLVELTRSSQRP